MTNNESKSRVYLVKDEDLGISKIGHKKDGNSRMETRESYIKNKYPTHLQCVKLSRPMQKKDALELESKLHKACEQYRTQYPEVTMSVEKGGQVFSVVCRANGYTEWFDLPAEVEAQIMLELELA